MSKRLTQEELDRVSGLSGREAAEVLGCGKSTVNDARRAARKHGGRLPTKDTPVDIDEVPNGREFFKEIKRGEDGEIIAQVLEDLDHEAILKLFGRDPEKVKIVGVLEETHWQYNGVDWNHRYRFKTTYADPDVELVDPIAVLEKLRGYKPLRFYSVLDSIDTEQEESAFCISINDIQLGQSFNGGSAATIEQFYDFIEGALARLHELRNIGRNLTKLVIVFGGDLVEGCTIYPNMTFSLDMDRKQQVEGVVALGLHALDTLAPHFDKVQVLAAKGNHGQHRINGNYTTLSDNDDTHTVEMMKLALERDPTMQHIDWVIAEEEDGVAVEVFDWVLGTTHGDTYAKVAGTSIDKKAQAWYKNMAAGREARFGLLARPDILIGHHFHHRKMSDWGACEWHQTPAQDRGSAYFEQRTGEYSEPGMLTWVMSESSRYKDELVIH